MKEKIISSTAIKSYLKDFSKDDLIKDIVYMASKFDGVKDFYKLKISPINEDEILNKYKKIIEDEFFPKRGFGKARLSIAKKAISEYKKVSNNIFNIADIMTFYVEQGVNFTKSYGDIDEPFYNSMESVYDQLLKFLIKNNIKDDFKIRCKKIVIDTHDMGWGFHDQLKYMYEDVYEINSQQ